MSTEGYRPNQTARAVPPGERDVKWVLRHRGAPSDFMNRYRAWARQAAARNLAGLRDAAPALMRVISDERTLFTALRHLVAEGSHSPGPDGLRYEDIASVGEWSWCRTLRDEIRAGEYAPGEEQVRRIPKGPGRGFRELSILNVEDRIVHRAVVEVLLPLLDPLFVPYSFGYRPRKGPLRALATAERLYRDRGLGVWVAADVRDAFPSVPVGRLLGVLRRYCPDDALLGFLELVIGRDGAPGLRQGSPLSPLCLNLYAHHVLDRVWGQQYPSVPLLRFADDLLLLCRTPGEARDAYANVVSLLRPAGFVLKECEEEAIRDVGAGEAVTWMGFGIGGAADGLRYTVTADAWASLADAFAAAHGKPNSPLAANAALVGWVHDKAPCYPTVDVGRAYTRIARLADDQSFEEIPDEPEVAEKWQLAHARWCKLRAKVGAAGDAE